MKLNTALTLTAVIGLSTAAPSITSNSNLGQKLLSSARRLDGNQEIDYSWVANYSLKFLGCHTTSQWNDDADGENGVKLANLNLVRFRLCPSNTCSSNNAYGCMEGYGDYIIDMNTYLQTYLDAADNNNAQQNNDWDLKAMVQCTQLNDGEYYTGTYCSSDGSSILMGVFTDDTCSNLADVYGGQETYTTVTGKELPHSKATLVGNECMSCKEGTNANDNDQQDADAVMEGCETLYETAGKCEQNMSNGGSDSSACQYMKGISLVYKEGRSNTTSSAASLFIGLFGCSFVLISSYAYYLKTKLDRAKVQLNDDQFLS